MPQNRPPRLRHNFSELCSGQDVPGVEVSEGIHNCLSKSRRFLRECRQSNLTGFGFRLSANKHAGSRRIYTAGWDTEPGGSVLFQTGIIHRSGVGEMEHGTTPTNAAKPRRSGCWGFELFTRAPGRQGTSGQNERFSCIPPVDILFQ